MSMDTSSRLYQCLSCHAPVVICSRCDHGQRYCTNGCSQVARKKSLKRARQKYQKSFRGRCNNAARQKRFRANKKQKVTHHSSITIPRHDVLSRSLTGVNKPAVPPKFGKIMICHHCGGVCSAFLRHDFLRYQFTRRNLRY
ncbi:MAG: hypothetical protein JKY81_10165 [Colwellia sp.]|nr:hypothetical protein [Colwellia sp.]